MKDCYKDLNDVVEEVFDYSYGGIGYTNEIYLKKYLEYEKLINEIDAGKDVTAEYLCDIWCDCIENNITPIDSVTEMWLNGKDV